MVNASRVWIIYFYVGLGLVGGHTVVAQPLDLSTDRRLLSFWEVVALQRYRLSSDLERRRGSLGFYDSELQVGRSQLTRVGLLKLWAAYTYTHFDFAEDTDLGLSTEKPFETVHDTRISLQFSTRLHPRWLARVIATIGTRMESGASVDDAIYSRFALGFSYQVSDRFAIGPGLLVRASFAEDFVILPIAVIDWQITDRLSFRSRSDFRLSYLLDAKRTLTLSAVMAPFDRKEFRLDDAGSAPGGIAKLRAFMAGAAVRWQPVQPLTVKGNLFAVLNQKLTIDDQSGREVVDEELKNSVEFLVSVRYRF